MPIEAFCWSAVTYDNMIIMVFAQFHVQETLKNREPDERRKVSVILVERSIARSPLCSAPDLTEPSFELPNALPWS